MAILFRAHAHELWEFLFIIKGNPICMLEGKRYTIKENTLMVFKPAQIHRVHAHGKRPYEYFSLMCDESVLSPQFMSALSNHVGIMTFKNSETIHQILWELYRQNESIYQSSYSERRMRFVEELLWNVLEAVALETSPIPVQEDPIVSDAISYIERNVHNIIRVNEICKAVGITKEGLYNRFIQNMLISPMKYVRAKKAALAKLASNNERALTEPLERYGFKNEESFKEAYKDFYRSVP